MRHCRVKVFKLMWRLFQGFTYSFSYLPYSNGYYIIGMYFTENNSPSLFASTCKMLYYGKPRCKIRSSYRRVMVESSCIFIICAYGNLTLACEPRLDHFKNPFIMRYQNDRIMIIKMRIPCYFKLINRRIYFNLLYKYS